MPNIHLPGMPGMPPAPAAVQIAAPLNDVQLVALVAAHLVGPNVNPAEAVETAFDLVAAAVVGARTGRMAHYLALHERQAAAGLTNA